MISYRLSFRVLFEKYKARRRSQRVPHECCLQNRLHMLPRLQVSKALLPCDHLPFLSCEIFRNKSRPSCCGSDRKQVVCVHVGFCVVFVRVNLGAPCAARGLDSIQALTAWHFAQTLRRHSVQAWASASFVAVPSL